MHKPLIGISSCLMGEEVRYDGQHKLDRFLANTLGNFVDYLPVCPEVECGMPIPRPAMRLVGDIEAPRLLTRESGEDMTGKMMRWIPEKLKELEKASLCGFIFKARSPSSGMERVKVYNERGGIAGSSPGIFAKEFMKHFPMLPVEDEGRLNDPDLRENFIERIFTLNRYRAAVRTTSLPAALVKFHSDHKYLLMSHSDKLCREMGRLIAMELKTEGIIGVYEGKLLEALKLQATVAKHVNVLHHIMGYFKKNLSHDEKAELLETIEHYRSDLVPLIVPITLLNHFERKYGDKYLMTQYYLHPHPIELKLRNHS